MSLNIRIRVWLDLLIFVFFFQINPFQNPLLINVNFLDILSLDYENYLYFVCLIRFFTSQSTIFQILGVRQAKFGHLATVLVQMCSWWHVTIFVQMCSYRHVTVFQMCSCWHVTVLVQMCSYRHVTVFVRMCCCWHVAVFVQMFSCCHVTVYAQICSFSQVTVFVLCSLFA